MARVEIQPGSQTSYARENCCIGSWPSNSGCTSLSPLNDISYDSAVMSLLSRQDYSALCRVSWRPPSGSSMLGFGRDFLPGVCGVGSLALVHGQAQERWNLGWACVCDRVWREEGSMILTAADISRLKELSGEQN